MRGAVESRCTIVPGDVWPDCGEPDTRIEHSAANAAQASVYVFARG